MNKYSKSLPHRVKVCKGFYGVSDQTAVTTGDLINMHFLKSTQVREGGREGGRGRGGGGRESRGTIQMKFVLLKINVLSLFFF